MDPCSPSTVDISFISPSRLGLTLISFRRWQTVVSMVLRGSEFVKMLLSPSHKFLRSISGSILVSIPTSISALMCVTNLSHFGRVLDPSCVTPSWDCFDNVQLPFIIQFVSENGGRHFATSIQGLFLCFDIKVSGDCLKPMDKDSEWITLSLPELLLSPPPDSLTCLQSTGLLDVSGLTSFEAVLAGGIGLEVNLGLVS